MPNEDRSERVSRLKTEVNGSLRSYLRRIDSSATASSTLLDLAASRAQTRTPDPMGGAVFPDNERRVRALAKEIKRLISEDKRRGLQG